MTKSEARRCGGTVERPGYAHSNDRFKCPGCPDCKPARWVCRHCGEKASIKLAAPPRPDKTVKCYRCDCGEDVYEDDGNCLNCGKASDESKLKDEPVMTVTSETGVTVDKVPFLKPRPDDVCECPDCNGRGWYPIEDAEGSPVQAHCDRCYGTGETTVSPPQPPHDPTLVEVALLVVDAAIHVATRRGYSPAQVRAALKEAMEKK